MVYFKEEQEFLRDRMNMDMAYQTFRVFAGRDSIYGGPFYPMWSSSIFPGPCIHWPPFYPPYALAIAWGYPWPMVLMKMQIPGPIPYNQQPWNNMISCGRVLCVPLMKSRFYREERWNSAYTVIQSG